MLSVVKAMFSQSVAYCDYPVRWQLGMQDPANFNAVAMQFFHDYLMVLLVVIVSIVFLLLAYIIKFFNDEVILTEEDLKAREFYAKNFHSSLIEIVWTVIPAIILLFIAVPSFNLLYSLEEKVQPSLTVKVIGHQWYWTYEYSDFYRKYGTMLIYDTYVRPKEYLTRGIMRLLETTSNVALPIGKHVRFLVTSADVLHSWALPSFGIKIDACPGRLNQITFFTTRLGLFYGQCSEICGINHGFMPISVRVVGPSHFRNGVFDEIRDFKKLNAEGLTTYIGFAD